jgi:hypothetical protein
VGHDGNPSLFDLLLLPLLFCLRLARRRFAEFATLGLAFRANHPLNGFYVGNIVWAPSARIAKSLKHVLSALGFELLARVFLIVWPALDVFNFPFANKARSFEPNGAVLAGRCREGVLGITNYYDSPRTESASVGRPEYGRVAI